MTRVLRSLGYRPMVMLLDIGTANLGFWWALLISSQGFMSIRDLHSHRGLALLNSTAVVVAFQLMDLYNNWLRCSRAHLAYCVVVASAISCIITVALAFVFGSLTVPRSVLLWCAVFQLILFGAYRLLGSTAYRYWFGGRKTVVVGETPESALRVAEEFATGDGLYSVRQCVTRADLEWPFTVLDQAAVVVLAEDIKQKQQIILHCFRKNKEVLIVPSIADLISHGSDVRGIQDLLIFAPRPHNFGAAESLVKRVFDLAGALFLLALTTPIFLLLMILIPVTSRGPIFFRQERLGRYRHKFYILKFRTMVPNAELLTGPVLAKERDPRVTALGRVLRATRLDELPQLWNVLRGEMSLVGPRPERHFFVKQYEKLLPAYDLRHGVKPGITGLAQIKSRYSSSVERKLHFDLLYIYRYSLMLDLTILFQTIIVVLRGKQSIGIKEHSPSLPRAEKHSVIPILEGTIRNAANNPRDSVRPV